jgi:hypothetical protein
MMRLATAISGIAAVAAGLFLGLFYEDRPMAVWLLRAAGSLDFFLGIVLLTAGAVVLAPMGFEYLKANRRRSGSPVRRYP